jgi:hypothetical protein
MSKSKPENIIESDNTHSRIISITSINNVIDWANNLFSDNFKVTDLTIKFIRPDVYFPFFVKGYNDTVHVFSVREYDIRINTFIEGHRCDVRLHCLASNLSSDLLVRVEEYINSNPRLFGLSMIIRKDVGDNAISNYHISLALYEKPM